MNQYLLSHVLPTDSLLWKDCQDSYEFFLSEEDWESESSYASQNVNETFEDFIIRIIEKLIADKHEEVALNYAIHGDPKTTEDLQKYYAIGEAWFNRENNQ